MNVQLSTLITYKEMEYIGQALQKIGWVVYGLEPPNEKWLQIFPSDSLILFKQLDDSRYDKEENVPYFLLSQEPNEDNLHMIVFPKGKDFDTIQDLLMWADEF